MIPGDGPISATPISSQFWSTVVPAIVITTPAAALPSGVRSGRAARRKIRVRRADFSSQENYEFALRAALRDANFAIREDLEAPRPERVTQRPPPQASRPQRPQAKIADTQIEVTQAMASALREALERDDEQGMLMILAAL